MENTDKNVVVGVFEDRASAVKAIDAFLQAGFAESQIGFASRSNTQELAQAQQHIKHGPKALARGIIGGLLGVADMLLVPITGPSDAASILATALPVTEEAIDRLPYPGSHADQRAHERPDDALTTPSHPSSETTTSETDDTSTPTSPTSETEHPERTGMVAGGVIGGALGAAAGALLIPGIGPVVAGGIIASALGGGAIGSVAGNFLGTFADIGIPQENARHYAQEIKSGRTVVTVRANGRSVEACAILNHHGAHDVQTH